MARLETWSTWRIGNDFVLQVHPDLKCHQKSRSGKTLTLLGLVVDSDRPECGPEAIVDSLFDGCETLDELFAASEALAGRWVMIFEHNDERAMLQDACGMRTVVYTRPAGAETWCASQTSLLADELGLTPDAEAVDFWHQSGKRIPKHIRAWPGAGTAYTDIAALLPNHYLDLRTWSTVRFFPRQPLQPLSLDDGVTRISRRLSRLLAGAHGSGPVVQEITAGLDSRCLLAASRGVSADTTYMTGQWTDIDPALSDTHRDITVPGNLLASLKLTHEVIRCSEGRVDQTIVDAFKTIDTLPAKQIAQRDQGIARALPNIHLLINGNGGEIGRCRLHPKQHPRSVDMTHACNLHWPGMSKNPFLKRQLEPWLKDATEAAEASGYRLLDLFYWEQKMARRVGRLFLHCDVVHETYSPYNTRSLLCDFLSVPEEYRRPGNGHMLQHGIINRLWPEALGEPVNPLTRSNRAARLVRRMRRRARGLGLPI